MKLLLLAGVDEEMAGFVCERYSPGVFVSTQQQGRHYRRQSSNQPILTAEKVDTIQYMLDGPLTAVAGRRCSSSSGGVRCASSRTLAGNKLQY